MELGEATATIRQTHILACGAVRVVMQCDPTFELVLNNLVHELSEGFLLASVPCREPVEIRATMELQKEPIAQDTLQGRYKHCSGHTYRSRWGLWDVQLRDFGSGLKPHARLALSTEVSPSSYPDVLKMFLRTVIASAAPLVDALMFHGCALASKDCSRALLFLGASGDGKTTLRQRLSQWTCLGDDTVFVQLDEATDFSVAGTPFAGSEGYDRVYRRVPLKGLYFLQPHGRMLSVESVSAEEGFGKLLSRLMWFVDGGPLRERMLDLVAKLSQFPRIGRLESSLHHDLTHVLGHA